VLSNRLLLAELTQEAGSFQQRPRLAVGADEEAGRHPLARKVFMNMLKRFHSGCVHVEEIGEAEDEDFRHRASRFDQFLQLVHRAEKQRAIDAVGFDIAADAGIAPRLRPRETARAG